VPAVSPPPDPQPNPPTLEEITATTAIPRKRSWLVISLLMSRPPPIHHAIVTLIQYLKNHTPFTGGALARITRL